MVTTPEGHYAGIVETAKAFAPELEEDAEVGTVAALQEATLDPAQDVRW